MSSVLAATLLAVLVLAGCTTPTDDPIPEPAGPSPRARPDAESDALAARVLDELDGFVTWLDDHDADGYIGEVGWPAGPGYDTERWNALADRWFAAADAADLWVTVWGAGAWWGTEYPLSPYVASDSHVINRPAPQAQIIESYADDMQIGVNVSGAEFGAPGGTQRRSEFSNTDSGSFGTDYRYDRPQSFAYLAGRGLDMVRLAFRWERIQPEPWGPLDRQELSRLRAAVRAAGDMELGVILNPHNYGSYFQSDGSGEGVATPIGHPDLPVSAFADLWERLSDAFAGEDAVIAYGLMNEPHDLADDPRRSALAWEDASQAAVDAIRAQGDDTLIMVPGANWSNVEGWAATHPEPWIDDPSGNVRYEAHHYFDADHSGAYELDYAAEIEAASR